MAGYPSPVGASHRKPQIGQSGGEMRYGRPLVRHDRSRAMSLGRGERGLLMSSRRKVPMALALKEAISEPPTFAESS